MATETTCWKRVRTPLWLNEFKANSIATADYSSMTKFLNRILGVEVELQNRLFKYFTDTLASIVLQAKHNGRWDMGILDIGSGHGENVKVLSSNVFKGNFCGSSTTVTLATVAVERGLSWKAAMGVWRDHEGDNDGFYLSNEVGL